MVDSNNPGQFGDRDDTEEQAGRGGQSQGQEDNSGNFANDKNKASEAGENNGQQNQGGDDEDES